MSIQASKYLRTHEHEGRSYATFWCPGCNEPHMVVTAGAGAWGYNGNPEAPTFTPSVKVTAEHRALVCHSFVTDGRIQFLADCTHALAGQTVPLDEWPEDYG
jgi:hypothetical protein